MGAGASVCNCGNKLMAYSQFCRKCGTQRPEAAVSLDEARAVFESSFQELKGGDGLVSKASLFGKLKKLVEDHEVHNKEDAEDLQNFEEHVKESATYVFDPQEHAEHLAMSPTLRIAFPGAFPSEDDSHNNVEASTTQGSTSGGLTVASVGAGGFAASEGVSTLGTPGDLKGAALVFFKLAQKAAVDSDRKTSGFGTTHHPAHISYPLLFKKFDIDNNKEMSQKEFVYTIRRVLGLKNSNISDDEVAMVYSAMDKNADGMVTLAEFSSFARGMEHSAGYHGAVQAGNKFAAAAHTISHNPFDHPSKLMYGSKEEDARKLPSVPHLANRKRMLTAEEKRATKDLDAVHLVLWHLAQHVAMHSDSKTSTGGGVNPAKVSYSQMFNMLDLDHNRNITRDEFAIVLRRHIGVGKQVTDADLNMIFDDANQNGDGGLSLREFANYARGAAASSNARGLAELKKEGATALVAATFRHSGEHPSAK